MKRIAVTGGGNYADAAELDRILTAVDKKHTIACLIQGGAPGADTLAADWARERGIPVTTFPADWTTHGKAAGPIRNEKMLREGDVHAVVAFKGRDGTQNCVDTARKMGIPVWEVPDREEKT